VAVSAPVTPQVKGAGANPLPLNVLASPLRAASLPVSSQPSPAFSALPSLDMTFASADPPLHDVPELELAVGINLVYVTNTTIFCPQHHRACWCKYTLSQLSATQLASSASLAIPIARGTLVIANKVVFGGKRSVSVGSPHLSHAVTTDSCIYRMYYRWGCLSLKVLKNLHLCRSNPKDVPGYALLGLDDQA
jgi:hypothetical protein